LSIRFFLATIPTVGDAIEALNGLCDDLAATLKQIADLSAELSSRDHIRVDNIQEVGAGFWYASHVSHSVCRSSASRTPRSYKTSTSHKSGR